MGSAPRLKLSDDRLVVAMGAGCRDRGQPLAAVKSRLPVDATWEGECQSSRAMSYGQRGPRFLLASGE
jgi:hypothetical protein